MSLNIVGFNRIKYDNCAEQQRLGMSVSPLTYRLYEGKYENCSKCIYDKFWRPQDLVNVESELRNQTRPLSKCDKFKYNPVGPQSTFNPNNPVIFAPEICPIVFNNIPRNITNGIPYIPTNICGPNGGLIGGGMF